MCFIYRSLIRYVICKYILPLCGLSVKAGEGPSQGTSIKDPWTRTTAGRTECGRRVGRAGESNGGKMGAIVIEQQ